MTSVEELRVYNLKKKNKCVVHHETVIPQPTDPNKHISMTVDKRIPLSFFKNEGMLW